MDSSVVVLVIFLVVLFVAAGLTAVQFNNVDKESKANKKLILDKHHQVSADLTDLTVKLARKSPSWKSRPLRGTRI
jgi:flagellar basal body-associated protein FliL